MNYLAHGLPFVDRPYVLAGTAVPDWLRISDPRVRMRERHVEPHVAADGTLGEVATGIAQHLADDDWFHVSPGFQDVTNRLSRMLRAVVETDGFRCGFVGHVLGEMLLDVVLARRDPTALDRYYAAVETVDPHDILSAVNTISHRGEATRLTEFVRIFRESRFLADYLDPERLLYRLNQVQQRVRLPELPPEVVDVIVAGETVVEERLAELLPRERYPAQP